MKKTLSYLLIATSLFALNPNNNLKEFLDFKNQTNQEFNNYKKELNEGYKEYVDSLSKGFIQYKKELSTYWKNPELSSKKVFVEYSKDKKIRKKVDYDNNYIEIDVISKNEKEAKAKMAKSLAKLTTETTKEAVNNNPVLKKVDEKLSNNPKLQNVVKKDTPSNEPVVGDMIFKKPPTIKEVVNFATNKVKKNKILKKPSKVKNNFVFTIKIKLPSDAFLAKARKFKQDVLKRANQFNIQAPFIYSIIHTESSFNPMARSYVPAFGLMQIVPTTAGADAYKMLYGKKKILTPGYLYNSHNNILIGSAYLKRIYYGYMRKIKNPVSRFYCSVAAYNTGAGNVACAFNSPEKDSKGVTVCRRSRGDYNIIKAAPKINSMTPHQVYNYLLANLKYDEPKHYLKRVSKRYLIYSKALKNGAL
jgi:membrane-bound lytic murein transglycosylase C